MRLCCGLGTWPFACHGMHEQRANGLIWPSKTAILRTTLRASNDDRPKETELKLNLSDIMPGAKRDGTGGDTRELPDALKGLSLNDKGDLVDEKSGKVLNEFGATRFDVAVRAMRGELTRHLEPDDDTEESGSGRIAESLIVFPAAYSFQAVGKLDKISEDDFVSGVRGAVQEALSKKVLDSQVVVKPRMGGKYVSVKVTAVVGNAEDIKAAFGDIQKVPGCVMWF